MVEFEKFQNTYEIVLSTDLFDAGFTAINIINIWRKLLKINGEGILIIPDKKDQVKQLLDLVDKS